MDAQAQSSKPRKRQFIAKKNCKKCHGTGRLGFLEGIKSMPIGCTCLKEVTSAS